MNRGKTRNMLTPSSMKKLVNVFEVEKSNDGEGGGRF
jgi:hypothetical protein